MGTAIVLVILAVVIALATKSLIKDKKNGKSISCGGDCKHCHVQRQEDRLDRSFWRCIKSLWDMLHQIFMGHYLNQRIAHDIILSRIK